MNSDWKMKWIIIGSKLQSPNPGHVTKRLSLYWIFWATWWSYTLVIQLEGIAQSFGILPELICYEHVTTKALVGKPKANTVSVYPAIVLFVFTALAWSFGVRRHSLTMHSILDIFRLNFRQETKIHYFVPKFNSNHGNCLKPHSGIFWEISQGVRHLQITCELITVRGQTMRKNKNLLKAV